MQATSLVSLLVAASCCLLTFGDSGIPHVNAPRRLVTKNLVLDNGLDWGSWGEVEYCPEGSFAADLEAKFEEYSVMDTDETALNAVKLYCITPETELLGYIMSTEGEMGQWQGVRPCTASYLTAMRARVLEPQGTFGDDMAVQNLQMECNYGEEVLTAVNGAKEVYTEEGDAKIPMGQYGTWSTCPEGSAICGIQIRYEPSDMIIDDTAINDISMFCCALNETATHNG